LTNGISSTIPDEEITDRTTVNLSATTPIKDVPLKYVTPSCPSHESPAVVIEGDHIGEIYIVREIKGDRVELRKTGPRRKNPTVLEMKVTSVAPCRL
jgi:hypothetical protein